jgi:hypothetical protein
MSAGPTDAVRLSAQALGPLLMVFAGLLAWRTDIGLSGAVAGGLLGGLALALHPLTEGWREARRALPLGWILALLTVGLALIAGGWCGPVLAPARQSSTLPIVEQAAQAAMALGAALVSGAAGALAVALLVGRAVDLRDEGS